MSLIKSKKSIAISTIVMATTILFFMMPEDRTNPNQHEIKKKNITEESQSKSKEPPLPRTSNNNKKKLTSLEKKINKERYLNDMAIKRMGLESSRERYTSVASKYNLDLPKEIIDRIENDNLSAQDEKLIIIAMSDMMNGEENFELELNQFNSFHEMKNAADNRKNTTGMFYYDVILQKNITYRDASADEIEELVIAGAALPDNAIFNMISMNNVDLAIDLYKRGIPVNTDYIDNFTGATPIEFLISLYSIYPDQKPSKISDDISKLVDIGLPLKVNDGTRDPLDLALSGARSQDPPGAEKLMKLAIKLNHMGIDLEDSHREALREISHLHPEVYGKYSADFK